MKKLIIILSVFMLDLGLEAMYNEANAQVVAERRIRKTNRRKAKRKVRRARRRVSRMAHVRYAGLPRWRSVVVTTPGSAIIVRQNGLTFRYHSGIFYRSSKDVFVISRPAVGVRVTTLPSARRRIVISNHSYYYYYGTFYQEVPESQEYEVVEAPEGALVDALPEGYEIEEIDGKEYYVLDDTYFQEVETLEMEDGIGYEVVKV